MRIRRLVKRLESRAFGRAAVLLLATGMSVCAGAEYARAQNSRAADLQYFRIGTGPTTGIYFPVGALIASMVSNPPGSRPCDRGGSCGVPNLIAVAQATQDSVERLQGIADRRLDSGLVQADVAHLAFNGEGPFAGKPLRNLRAIAALYTEYLHVVVRTGAGIRSFADLKGKRVGLDLDGSGTRLMVQLVFPHLGIPPRDLKIETLSVTQAGDQLRARRLDTFAFTSGIPAEPIQRLTDDTSIGLLPVPARIRERVASSGTGIFAAEIPDGTYTGIPATPTLGTRALWVVPAETDPELVYELTRALWHPNNQRLLASGPAAARAMRVQDATADLTIPLHPGAARYYREAGYAVPSIADTLTPPRQAPIPPPPPRKPPERG
jgi:TRAP transporter TAXI family solute receptor